MFQYSERLDRDYIRVLKVLPGTGDKIHCSLSVIGLRAETASYTALSYNWGPETDPHYKIYVNGKELLVRHNLFQALLVFRTQPTSNYWIDAICINQDDVNEKNHQLPLMGKIYSLARSVLIWLGGSMDNSDLVMNTIQKLDKDALTRNEFLEAFASFIRRPWFTRTWILQEFALGQTTPLMACGNGPLVSWDIFMEAYAAIGEDVSSGGQNLAPEEMFKSTKAKSSISSSLESAHSSVYALHTLRNTKIPDGLKLFLCLQMSGAFHATDPRDKVYGLLGLVDKTCREHLEPDYRKSVEMVYCDAMSYVLCDDHHIFAYLGLPLLKGDSRDLPSWIPDLSRINNGTHSTVFWGGLGTGKPLPESVVQVSDHKRCLTMNGIHVDVIDEIVRFPSKWYSSYYSAAIEDYQAVSRLARRGQDVDSNSLKSILKELTSMLGDIERSGCFEPHEIGAFHAVAEMGRQVIEASPQSPESASKAMNVVDAAFDFAKENRHVAHFMVNAAHSFFQAIHDVENLMNMKQASAAGKFHSDESLWKTLAASFSTMDDLLKDEKACGQDFEILLQYAAKAPLTQHVPKGGTECWVSYGEGFGEVFKFLFLNHLCVQLSQVLTDERCFFLCQESGIYGVAAPGVRKGDVLALLVPGADIPFVLREANDSYRMVGVAHLPPKRRESLIAKRSDKSFLQEFRIL